MVVGVRSHCARNLLITCLLLIKAESPHEAEGGGTGVRGQVYTLYIDAGLVEKD